MLGTLVGNVGLGAGDDRLILANFDSSNSYSGGAGSDTIERRTTSTYENPLAFSGDEVSDFERLAVSGGVVAEVWVSVLIRQMSPGLDRLDVASDATPKFTRLQIIRDDSACAICGRRDRGPKWLRYRVS